MRWERISSANGRLLLQCTGSLLIHYPWYWSSCGFFFIMTMYFFCMYYYYNCYCYYWFEIWGNLVYILIIKKEGGKNNILLLTIYWLELFIYSDKWTPLLFFCFLFNSLFYSFIQCNWYHACIQYLFIKTFYQQVFCLEW